MKSDCKYITCKHNNRDVCDLFSDLRDEKYFEAVQTCEHDGTHYELDAEKAYLFCDDYDKLLTNYEQVQNTLRTIKRDIVMCDKMLKKR